MMPAGSCDVKEDTLPDGTVLLTYADGTVVQQNTDGVHTTFRADGTRVEQNPDGTQVVVFISGISVTTYTDGSSMQYDPATQVQIVTRADGVTEQTNSDGTVIITQLDGSMVQKNTDGSMITTGVDGMQWVTRADGSSYIMDSAALAANSANPQLGTQSQLLFESNTTLIDITQDSAGIGEGDFTISDDVWCSVGEVEVLQGSGSTKQLRFVPPEGYTGTCKIQYTILQDGCSVQREIEVHVATSFAHTEDDQEGTWRVSF